MIYEYFYYIICILCTLSYHDSETSGIQVGIKKKILIFDGKRMKC